MSTGGRWLEGEAMNDTESGLGDLVERVTTRLSTTLVIAAGIVGLALYARPAPPRYQLVAMGSQVARIDSRTGAMIVCDAGGRCANLHKPGGRIARTPAPPAVSAPAPAPALPKPAPAPASAPAPQPAG
jgi:hypothetical protein